uniref:Uncharacterized protein n=1 Tax=Mycena chlorophos TaxID=658473 RepID=A0ABQ0M7Z1_MYCCL|nr:predicted protein [Mycena chlorophos]
MSTDLVPQRFVFLFLVVANADPSTASPRTPSIAVGFSSLTPLSPSSPTQPPPQTLGKRKTPASDCDDEELDRKPLILPPEVVNVPVELQGEYAAGHVLCGACSGPVSFRDPASGAFSIREWDAHRSTCPHAQQQRPQHPLSFPPPHALSATVVPPLKRRRAKRTEEERIAYLRADQHVAQFEAYRVLCASCDKWIRLRPNSTYCSIPWDAHRKSCLAKKAGATSQHANPNPRPPPAPTYPTAFEEITRDAHVRRVETDRVMCGICDKWIGLGDDPAAAAQVQVWHEHRDACQKTAAALRNVAAAASSAPVPIPPPSSQSPAPASISTAGTTNGSGSSSNTVVVSHAPVHLPLPDAPHVVLDLSPSNYAAPHESRRRNAEQRAATLRADVLIRAVEPNRVFCSLCTKWVQLRQDSSYCAYPWLQHRGKCLARYQRRAQKAADLSASGAAPNGRPGPRHDVDPEDVVPLSALGRNGRVPAGPVNAHPPRTIPGGYTTVSAPQWKNEDGDADADGEDVDADGDSYMEDDGNERGNGNGASGSSSRAVAVVNSIPPLPPPAIVSRRAVPVNLADLDSPVGRRNFIFASIEYLFRTTHESSDDLSVGALLTYVNAAMPTDKHEDYDIVEVARAASVLNGRFKLEGDMIRVVGAE